MRRGTQYLLLAACLVLLLLSVSMSSPAARAENVAVQPLSAVKSLGPNTWAIGEGNFLVEGRSEFALFVQELLDMLRTDAPVVSQLADLYVDRLWEQACATCPVGFDPVGHDGYGRTIYIRITPADRIWPKEAAARLVHEIGHAYLYSTCQQWWGVQGERLALGWQASALELLGGNAHWVDYYRHAAHNHALLSSYPVPAANLKPGC